MTRTSPTPMPEPADGAPYRRVVPETARRIHRSVPLLLRLCVLFERRRTQFALLVAVVVAFALWRGAPQVDWGLVGFEGPTDRYLGRVVHMAPLGSPTRKHGQAYRVVFLYEHDGRTWSGTAIAGNHQLEEGYEVYVEVPRGHDEYATVVGLARPEVSHQIFFVVAALELLLLGYVAATVLARGRLLPLLAHGRVAEGRVVRMRYGRWDHPRDHVWDLHVDYEDHFGRTHRAVETTRDLRDADPEAVTSVVYDPDVPARAVVLGCLPGAPRVVGDEVRSDAPAARFVPALVLPVLWIVANVAGAILAL